MILYPRSPGNFLSFPKLTLSAGVRPRGTPGFSQLQVKGISSTQIVLVSAVGTVLQCTKDALASILLHIGGQQRHLFLLCQHRCLQTVALVDHRIMVDTGYSTVGDTGQALAEPAATTGTVLPSPSLYTDTLSIGDTSMGDLLQGGIEQSAPECCLVFPILRKMPCWIAQWQVDSPKTLWWS